LPVSACLFHVSGEIKQKTSTFCVLNVRSVLSSYDISATQLEYKNFTENMFKQQT